MYEEPQLIHDVPHVGALLDIVLELRPEVGVEVVPSLELELSHMPEMLPEAVTGMLKAPLLLPQEGFDGVTVLSLNTAPTAADVAETEVSFETSSPPQAPPESGEAEGNQIHEPVLVYVTTVHPHTFSLRLYRGASRSCACLSISARSSLLENKAVTVWTRNKATRKRAREGKRIIIGI